MDYDRVLSTIDRIYEDALTGADWTNVVEDVAEVTGSEVAWSVLFAPSLGLNIVVAPRSDPEIISDYQRFWWAKDVTLRATITSPVGKITSLKDTGADVFLASPFYNEFWRRSGHATERLAANLATGPGAMACIGIQPKRSTNVIAPDTARTFAALLPHLIRYVRIRSAMRMLELERDMFCVSPGSGVLLVGKDAELIVMNDPARRILAENGRIRLSDGGIVLASAASTARLHRLIASCARPDATLARGGCIRQIDDDGSALAIEVLPFTRSQPSAGPECVGSARPAALLVFSDPERRRKDFLGRVRQAGVISRMA